MSIFDTYKFDTARDKALLRSAYVQRFEGFEDAEFFAEIAFRREVLQISVLDKSAELYAQNVEVMFSDPDFTRSFARAEYFRELDSWSTPITPQELAEITGGAEAIG